MWAKTGSMTGVSSLSGYAENANFPEQVPQRSASLLYGSDHHTHLQTLIFSIIVNGNALGQSAARGVIDTVVEALVELRDC